jgi:hypothetical protein
MNLPPSAQQVTDQQRVAAHNDSTILMLRSYLKYTTLIKYAKAMETLLQLQELNLALYDAILDIHAFYPSSHHENLSLSLVDTIQPMHNSAHSASPCRIT